MVLTSAQRHQLRQHQRVLTVPRIAELRQKRQGLRYGQRRRWGTCHIGSGHEKLGQRNQAYQGTLSGFNEKVRARETPIESSGARRQNPCRFHYKTL